MSAPASRRGVAVAGNLIVDRLHVIDGFPALGEVGYILEEGGCSTGGAACNVSIDLARLMPSLPVKTLGMLGADESGDLVRAGLAACPSIDISGVKTGGGTSYTLVMQDRRTGQRTFLQYRGANDLFDEGCIDWNTLSVRLLHVGYVLLLKRLDERDEQYGTRLARLLCHAQERGILTSVDAVSEAGGRLRELMPPALRYTDYCVVNEYEAQQITGVTLRENGALTEGAMPRALEALKAMGVSRWAVIHAPEACYGLDEQGKLLRQRSLCLPDGYIAGTVGAGDAFCAGVLLCAHQGQTLAQAMKLGVCAAACALSAPDSSSGLRTADDALALYERYKLKD